MQIGRSSLSFELPLSFEQAAAYRKANGQYVRKNQWRDITVRVPIKENVISVSLEIVVRLFFTRFVSLKCTLLSYMMKSRKDDVVYERKDQSSICG